MTARSDSRGGTAAAGTTAIGRRRGGLLVCLGVLAAVGAPAAAQETGDTAGQAARGAAAAGSPAKPTPPPPARATSPLGRTPSMYETGRVGKMAVQEAGVQIRQTSGRAQPREQHIAPRTTAPAPPPRTAGTIVDPVAFDHDLQGRFARLRSCKLEVARQRRTTPGALAGSRLLLRWTILPDGHVADTRVVAVARVNGKVADCIKREMSQWAFDPPRGGPATIERPFSF